MLWVCSHIHHFVFNEFVFVLIYTINLNERIFHLLHFLSYKMIIITLFSSIFLLVGQNLSQTNLCFSYTLLPYPSIRSFFLGDMQCNLTVLLEFLFKSKLPFPSLKDAWITLSSSLMLKYTISSPLIQNILENISFPSLEGSLNYIPLPSYVKSTL